MGYFSGSMLFCSLIPKHLKGIDIVAVSPDGNPGAANVFIHCGWELGLVCLFFDMLKGFIPVFAAVKLLDASDWQFVFVMIAPVLGHAFSIFNGLRGGKCISTLFGETIALLPVSPVAPVLAGIYIFFSTLILYFFFNSSINNLVANL